jgi:hypothetical protein
VLSGQGSGDWRTAEARSSPLEQHDASAFDAETGDSADARERRNQSDVREKCGFESGFYSQGETAMSSRMREQENGNRNAEARREINPLENVLAPTVDDSIMILHTGLFALGRNRAIQSGTTEPRQEDIESLESHARAAAQATYCDAYDPEKLPQDRMTHAEYDKLLTDRKQGEAAEDETAANARDASERCARTAKAGDKPKVQTFLIVFAVLVIALTVAPTFHDLVFRTIPDDILAHFLSLVSGAGVGMLITWTILHGRRTVWRWVGLAAGIAMGIGLGVVRLSAVESAGEMLFALGFTIVEISVVLLLEWYAIGLRASEDQWAVRNAVEAEAIGFRDAANAEHARRVERLQRINEAIAEKIAHVTDRHNRNDVVRLETAAVKAVLDGYNAGIAENRGHVAGVTRRN